jgi:5'-deoxynucleotidase YfbR-like HD superfamily hydrolase
LDLIHPTPWDWEISDLTAGQATIYRWKEATVWSRPLVLTQHNFSVLEICKSFSPTGIDPGLQIACLVHDGSESLSGFGDVITPLKPFLGPAYHVLEDRMQRVIHRRLGLKEVLPPSWKAMIKKADKIAAASEGLHVAGWTREQIRRDLLIKELPLLDDPVAARFGGVPWEPWEPAIATRRYQAELDRLLAMRGD